MQRQRLRVGAERGAPVEQSALEPRLQATRLAARHAHPAAREDAAVPVLEEDQLGDPVVEQQVKLLEEGVLRDFKSDD